jgi:hypothetical protein
MSVLKLQIAKQIRKKLGSEVIIADSDTPPSYTRARERDALDSIGEDKS